MDITDPAKPEFLFLLAKWRQKKAENLIKLVNNLTVKLMNSVDQIVEGGREVEAYVEKAMKELEPSKKYVAQLEKMVT